MFENDGDNRLTADPYAPLSVSEADELARELTAERLGVRCDNSIFAPYHERRRSTVRLLPFPLSAQGIQDAVAENSPWPEG